MAKSVRLNEWEQEELRKKAVEVNQKLIKIGKQPLRDSELVHEILKQTIGLVEVSTKGELIIIT